jgi:serine/threonine protein kinase
MGLESYEVGEQILTRGPSVFYRATNVLLGHEVALRRLTVDPARAEDARQTFYREMRLCAALAHPHVSRPLDVFEADGYLWSVHENRGFRNAYELTQESGPLSVADAARVGAHIADALAHMASRGYVHGKVNPATVVVDDRRDALLINLVKAADLKAGVWPLRPAVLGLTPFSSPEEFRGERPTAASDLYGLAATIVYWLVLRWPRGGATEEEALRRARDGAPLVDLRDLRPDVPPALAARLVRALEPDPVKRTGSVAGLGSLLTETWQRLAAEVPSGFGPGARLVPEGGTCTVEIVGRHGAGAFGVVLKGRVDSGAEVAVKALKPEHRDNREAEERFVREARAMRQVDHPNVVRIHGVGEEGGTPYAVMDFVSGPDLATLLLRQGSLPPRRVARIGAGIAHGLAAIHREGIIHRDLKPHNILVADGDRAVIADFGVARAADVTRMTHTGSIVGTPVYMAPEQFEEGRPPTAAVDLWALGTILFELLTGRPPFPGPDTVSTMKAIREHPFPPLDPEIPEVLASVTRRLLEKHPDARYAEAAEVAVALEILADA